MNNFIAKAGIHLNALFFIVGSIIAVFSIGAGVGSGTGFMSVASGIVVFVGTIVACTFIALLARILEELEKLNAR